MYQIFTKKYYYVCSTNITTIATLYIPLKQYSISEVKEIEFGNTDFNLQYIF